MKKKILAGLVGLGLTSLMATDYILQLNDKSFTVSIEKENMIRIDNKTYKIKLFKNIPDLGHQIATAPIIP